MEGGRAIITCTRRWQPLAAARSLGEWGIEVISGGEHAMTPSSFSRYSIADFRYPSSSQAIILEQPGLNLFGVWAGRNERMHAQDQSAAE
jgi:hypothetical protein